MRRGLKLVVLPGEFQWIVALFIVVEILGLSVEGRWMLLRLVQLVGDLAAHFLWHRGSHGIKNPSGPEPSSR